MSKSKLREPFLSAYRKIEELQKYDRYLAAYIFGSVVRGEQDKNSDLDVMVIVDENNNCKEINHPIINGIKLDITFRSLAQIKEINDDVVKKGERSIHQVTFNQICKDDLGYYFIFESLGEKTRIGGGGSAPSHFAYTDFDGELHIIERIPANIKSNIDVPSTYGKGAAYYGCRKIYATNEIEYLIGCGGGDGPAGMSQVFVFRLSDESMHEKAICYYGPESRKICFNRNGEKYYENIGDIE